MLRLIHAQTVQGAILVDDIDDGLPNKTAHRVGGNPDVMAMDGYATAEKQPVYIARNQAAQGFPALPGYIDLRETDRVKLSAGKGKISGLAKAGYITVTSFQASDIAAPGLTTADLDTPSAGALTLTGTTFVSLAPATTSVVITGTGAKTLTASQITTGGGTVSATSIVIPAALIPGVATGTSSAKVVANGKSSPVVALS